MGKVVNIEVINTGVQAKIDALLKAGHNVAMFRTIGSVVANKVRFCFKLGIDPWGSPWAALKFRKGQPLVRTGLLRRIFVKADGSGVSVGTNRKYARTHQFGATIVPRPENKRGLLVFPGPKGMIFSKGVKIPQRAFLPQKTFGAPVVLPPSWSAAVVKALRTYFTKAAA